MAMIYAIYFVGGDNGLRTHLRHDQHQEQSRNIWIPIIEMIELRYLFEENHIKSSIFNWLDLIEFSHNRVFRHCSHVTFVRFRKQRKHLFGPDDCGVNFQPFCSCSCCFTKINSFVHFKFIRSSFFVISWNSDTNINITVYTLFVGW